MKTVNHPWLSDLKFFMSCVKDSGCHFLTGNLEAFSAATNPMNCFEVTLSELEVDEEHLVCAATALLHGILFLRSTPQKEESSSNSLLGRHGECPSLLYFSYPKTSLVAGVDTLVSEAARTFRDHAKL